MNARQGKDRSWREWKGSNKSSRELMACARWKNVKRCWLKVKLFSDSAHAVGSRLLLPLLLSPSVAFPLVFPVVKPNSKSG
ncbi:hypothetical protein NMG60_11002029 [Bertholletia excelsa]